MKIVILFMFIVGVSCIYGDFIVPQSDPVYEFLEMTNNLKSTNLNHFHYPLYYNDIINELESLTKSRSNPQYAKQASYHLQRLKMNFKDGTEIAVWPIKKTTTSISELFRKDPAHKRLVTFTDPKKVKNQVLPFISTTKNETNIYVSGMLGYNYDIRSADNSSVSRVRKYYGIETAGNFTPNFGYFLMFRKGHYLGDADFIKENPYLSIMGKSHYQDGDRFYQVDMISELDFKNPYLNLSAGYGSFDIGKSLSSSIILNSSVTPYGYLKFNKSFGMLEYNGITTQLIPERFETSTEYRSKSMAIQTLSLHSRSISLGVGNTIVYGDRTIDLAYSTPLAIYKIMDNKYHGKDNTLLYLFSEIRPVSGLNFYSNVLFDDIRNSRFTSSEYLSFGAVQGGLLYQVNSFPMEVGSEITAVGPSTYSHKSKHYTYTHDDLLLGHQHGSNFLSFSGRIRYHFPQVSFGFFYDNVQQGDIGNHPNNGAGDQKFLANNISRKEFFKINVDLRLIPELHIYSRYEYNKLSDKELHYVFTGAEFKY